MPTLFSVVDTLADRVVPIGYSRLGYLLRRPWRDSSDPAPDAGRGRLAVVTGASSGIGKAAVTQLARIGARVVMVVRNAERGERVRSAILDEVPCADLEVRTCDIADLDSVRALGRALAAAQRTVDVLVHNAGVLPAMRRTSPDRHELTLATHVLGPVLLTEILRPAMARSNSARVIFVSSGGMYTQRVRSDDPEYSRGEYRGATAYARTKRMQVALLSELAPRYAADGITVHATHPGWADTPGVAESMPGFYRIMRPLLRTPGQAADTITWLAATSTALPSGQLWHDRRCRGAHYLPVTRESADQRAELWRYCADAIGLE